MKILLAADGSKFTKKALAFVAANENLCGPKDELFVLNVQAPVPPRVKAMLGAAAIRDYQEDEARKVLGPIETFLRRHQLEFRASWVVGSAAAELLAAAKRE